MPWWREQPELEKHTADGDRGDVQHRASSSRSARRIRGTLRRCCDARLPALVVCPDDQSTHAARFGPSDGDGFGLELSAPHPVVPGRQTVCLISFRLDNRTGVFICPVRDHDVDEAVLWFHPPLMLSAVETRGVFRVPLEPPLEILAGSPSSHSRRPALCRDISLAGALIEFTDPADGANVDVGDVIDLRIGFEGEAVRLRAEVRHLRGRQLGTFFPGSYVDGMLRPPEPIRQLVNRLERRWLKCNRMVKK